MPFSIVFLLLSECSAVRVSLFFKNAKFLYAVFPEYWWWVVGAGWLFGAGGTKCLSSATLSFSFVFVPLSQSCADCPFPAWIVPDRFLCCTFGNVTRTHRAESTAQAVGPNKPQLAM